jgi:CPA2 family monovalent cation:H+ antiporter-2
VRARLGDATRPEVLEHAGIATALVLVVTLPDHIAARLIIAEVRATHPGLPVVARARYHRHVEGLKLGPEDLVVDEEEAVGRLLGFEAYRVADQERKRRAGLSDAQPS